MAKIFLSYDHADVKSARRLYKELCTETGHEVWFDEQSLLGGCRVTPAIRKAIRESRFFVGLFSKRSVSSRGYRHAEVREAMEVLAEYPDHKVYAIPTRLDDCNLPDDRLNALRRVDLFPRWSDGVASLCRAVGKTRRPVDQLRTLVPGLYHYRVALLDLDLRLPMLSHLAEELNACQKFFHFATHGSPRVRRTTVEIKGIKNFSIDRVPTQFYAESKYLAVDLIASFTRFPLAFTSGDSLCSNYFTQSAGPQKRFLFLSTANLREYASMANRTFEDSLVYLVTGELVDFFTNTGYHAATRACLMDECKNRIDIVPGLAARQLCRQCQKTFKTPGLRAAVEALLAWRPDHPAHASSP